MVKNVYSIFLKGLLAILPIAITVYFFVWLVKFIESMFAWLARLILPAEWYAPGIGFALGIVTIFFIGLALQFWLTRALAGWCESLLQRAPVVSDIYDSVKDMIKYFTDKGDQNAAQVVMVTCSRDPEIKLIGIVTRDNFENAPKGIGGEQIISVYLPMSYQIGGYTIYIDKSHCTPIEMRKKDAIKWVIMGGVEAK